MNGKIRKMISLSLICTSLLLFAISCSSMKEIFGWPKFTEPGDAMMSQFLSNTRPHQGNPDSHYLLGCYYQERGRHKEAMEEFKKALSINPGYVKAYNGLGVSYDLLGEYSKAIDFYKQALNLNPDLDYVHNNLGYSYLLQKNLDEAIITFKKAIAVNDQGRRLHNNLGLAYAEKGQYDLALSEFKLAADEAKAHYNMAQVYFKKGIFDDAKSHYAVALNLNPSLTIVRTGLNAADALARVFQPTPGKAEPQKLIIPDQPVIKKEIEKIVTADQPPAVKPDSRESMPSGQLGIAVVDIEELRTTEQFAAKNKEPAELGASNLTTAISGPSVSQKTESGDSEAFYQLQVASFRYQENAILAARSIQELGYQTNVKYWENGGRDKWYRLIIGPFETRDEVLTFKNKIAEKYQFSPIILKIMTEESEPKMISNLKQIARKGELSPFNRVEIEISNGNGAPRMAKKVGDYLKGRGLKVTRLTNANNFGHTGTRIFYQKEYDEAADRVAEHLPVFRSKEEIEKFDRPNIRIKILIGKDLIPHHKVFENRKSS